MLFVYHFTFHSILCIWHRLLNVSALSRVDSHVFFFLTLQSYCCYANPYANCYGKRVKTAAFLMSVNWCNRKRLIFAHNLNDGVLGFWYWKVWVLILESLGFDIGKFGFGRWKVWFWMLDNFGSDADVLWVRMLICFGFSAGKWWNEGLQADALWVWICCSMQYWGRCARLSYCLKTYWAVMMQPSLLE